MDAMNLAYSEGFVYKAPEAITPNDPEDDVQEPLYRRHGSSERRPLFGRGRR